MPALVDLFANLQIQIIVVFIGVDVVLGVVGAVVRKEFKVGKLADFLGKSVVGYVFGYAVLRLVAEALPSLSFVSFAAFFFILASLLASMVRNLAKLGLRLPAIEKM